MGGWVSECVRVCDLDYNYTFKFGTLCANAYSRGSLLISDPSSDHGRTEVKLFIAN